MNRRVLTPYLLLALLGVAVLGAVSYKRFAAGREFAQQATLARQDAERISTQVILFSEHKLAAGVNFSNAVEKLGVDPPTAAVIASSAQSVYDLRHVRAGNRLAVGRSVLGELRAVRYQIDADRMLWVVPLGPTDRGFHAEIKTILSTTEVAGVSGEIRDSLFNAWPRSSVGTWTSTPIRARATSSAW